MAKTGKKSALPAIIVTAIIVAVLCIFTPKLVHKCYSCDKTFVGTGYEMGKIESSLTDWFGNEEDKEKDKILCKDCAEERLKLYGLFGKELDDYKRPLF